MAEEVEGKESGKAWQELKEEEEEEEEEEDGEEEPALDEDDDDEEEEEDEEEDEVIEEEAREIVEDDLEEEDLESREETDIEAEEHKVEEMWQGKSNVLVAVRVRPMNSKEKCSTRSVVKVVDNRMVVVIGESKNSSSQDVLRKNRSREKRYMFDFAFGPEIPTKRVYGHTTKFLIDGVVIGYNATVFAYGATGAGKTYTMLGGSGDSTSSDQGIMVLTLQDLFLKINENMRKSRRGQDCTPKKPNELSDTDEGEADEAKTQPQSTPASAGSCRSQEIGLTYKVSCSFLEVYNEMIRDLLTPSSEYLDLREDPVKGPTVTGLSEVEAACAEDIMNLLRKGNSRRTTEGTAANQASSRSHAVLQITVERRDNGVNSNAVAVSNVTMGKLSLIDLAGSERASVTQNRGIRLVEGANINRSLLALGNCINALREGGKGAFVPYRDSKLTRLLKDSLGGNCRTVMVAAVSPAKNQIEETLNTLKYANRAKNIKTQAERNVLNVDYHVTEYVNLISRLKTEITSLRNQLKKPPTTLQQLQQQQILQQRLDQVVAQQQPHQKTVGQGGGSRKSVEKQQMALLREQLVLNFKERMQLCRSLIEIEAQNIANNSELEMHNLVIQRWEESLDRKIAMRQNKAAQETDDEAAEEREEEEGGVAQPHSTVDYEQKHRDQPEHEREQEREREEFEEEDDDEAYEDEEDEDEDEEDEEDEDMEDELSEDGARPRQEETDADDEREEGEEKLGSRCRNGKNNKKKKRKLSIVTEPPNVRSARIEAQQLHRANLKNSQLKLDIERRLRENEKASAALRHQMETRITSEERRELMELEYRIGMLELENMELERSRMLHRCSVQYKDMLIKRLLTQLEVRDTIIEEQRKLLDDHGVGMHTVEDVLEEHFSGLESLHMLQSLPTGVPATPGTPTPRHLMLGGTLVRTSIRPISGSLQAMSQKMQQAHKPAEGSAAHGLRGVAGRNSRFAPSSSTTLFSDKRTSIYGLPSPATGRQMVPLHRLEEELTRIEMSNPYTPLNGESAAKASARKANDDDAEENGASGRSGRSEARKKSKSMFPPTSTTQERERRRQKRFQSNLVLQGGQQKKSHPYLRHSQLMKQKPAKDSSRKARSRLSGVQEESSTTSKSERGKKQRLAAPSKLSGATSGAAGMTVKLRPKRGSSMGKSTAGKASLKQKSQQQQSTSSFQGMQRHRNVYDPTEDRPDSRNEGGHLNASSNQQEHAPVSLPPIRTNSNNISNSCTTFSRPIHVASFHGHSSDNTSPSLNEGEDDEELFQRSAVVAPAPPFSPATPPQDKVNSARSNSSLDSVSRRGMFCEKRDALTRLNSKIASGVSLLEESRRRFEEPHTPEEKAQQPESDAIELLDAMAESMDEVSAANNTQALKEAKRQEKKEKKKLEKRWAEVNFVLRKTIHCAQDYNHVRKTAERSLTFLDQLDKKAAELNVLRGTLSRMLLPYSEDTAAAEQRANTPVTGDSPLDSVMDFNTRKLMVNQANDLRSLVRVKIADDADLDQARTAVTEVKGFLDKIEAFASKKNVTPFEVLSSLKAR